MFIKFIFMSVNIYFLLFFITSTFSETDVCDAFEKDCHSDKIVKKATSHMYSSDSNNREKWKEIIHIINKTNSSYEECSSESCSCYLRLIWSNYIGGFIGYFKRMDFII
ncbi:uncharacterized protein CEXT_513601 [Caerostris extrusa]|uniref:Uncharacterized protein n=1 Tax=Caerostris extrusa TaxID=172846 RepID=A0AAV4PE99_CAEEX|nr:uncharacterized protein CEXT_513601 [Caerostris extrusa]